jgi:hypothetical protein
MGFFGTGSIAVEASRSCDIYLTGVNGVLCATAPMAGFRIGTGFLRRFN